MNDDKTASEGSITFTVKQFRTIIGGIVSGVVLIGSISGSGVIRVDKFGLSDYERLEAEHEKHEDHKRQVMEFRIRRDMPPAATKARIRAIERCLERNCTDFKSATDEWQ